MIDILVTVIIPTYNNKDLLKRSLDSVPIRDDIEVIVIDDGSTDGTNEFLEEYWKNRVYSVPIGVYNWHHYYISHSGFGAAMNAGYDRANGMYVYELDEDDYLYTSQWIDIFKELDGTDIVYVAGKNNLGYLFDVDPSIKFYYGAFWLKFVKKEFLGEHRMRTDINIADYYLNKEIQQENHTEKYTHSVVYHYNNPREGSIMWNINHGVKETK